MLLFKGEFYKDEFLRKCREFLRAMEKHIEAEEFDYPEFPSLKYKLAECESKDMIYKKMLYADRIYAALFKKVNQQNWDEVIFPFQIAMEMSSNRLFGDAKFEGELQSIGERWQERKEMLDAVQNNKRSGAARRAQKTVSEKELGDFARKMNRGESKNRFPRAGKH